MSTMKIVFALALGCPLLGFLGLSASALEFSNGETAFNGPLRLLRAAATETTIESYPVYYQFTVEVPANLDEPLGRLVIAIPTEFGDFGLRPPEPKVVRAFVPTAPYVKAPQYPARELPVDVQVARTQVALSFREPVTPGSVVTVEWGPLRNPPQDGLYQYEVTAFPRGPAPRSQYVGLGRIVIRRGGSGR